MVINPCRNIVFGSQSTTTINGICDIYCEVCLCENDFWPSCISLGPQYTLLGHSGVSTAEILLGEFQAFPIGSFVRHVLLFYGAMVRQYAIIVLFHLQPTAR